MAEEKQEENWWHTASIVCEIRNLFSKRAWSVAECHPKAHDDNVMRVDGSELEKFFPKR